MLAYPIYAFRVLVQTVANLFRRLRRPPEYISFRLESSYSEYRRAVENPILRRLRPPKPSLQDLAAQFRMVANDPRVVGVVLHFRPLIMQGAALESLRDLILGLRRAGKRVVAWGTSYVGTSYYVACSADEILLQPGGTIEPLGLAATYPYLADALARVGVQGDFMPISPFKSTADMVTRKDMSDEVREMSNWLMDSAYAERLSAIAEGRNLTEKEARDLVDQTPCTDLKALEIGAVDGVIGEEHLPDHLRRGETPARLQAWGDARGSLLRGRTPPPGKHIALIPIEGIILDGESGRPPVKPPFRVPILLEPRAGDLTVVQAVRQAMCDRRAAALVVYVNSPGGSATASEAMRAALEKAASAKPLVICMGPVAASGGYWVSTPGQTILAQPSTVTGSIGVIIGKIVASGLLNRLSIARETISRGRFSRLNDLEAPFTKEEREVIAATLQRIYRLFLERVSESRNMTINEVESLAAGRVWTGRQALEHHLIDELGGLERGLARARKLAKLHEQAAVRLTIPGKRILSPVPNPSTLAYALENLRPFQRARPLCLCPISLESDATMAS